MKQIQLQKLVINNFKKIESLEVNFQEKNTVITGKNGLCKTTIFDSFCWCLFGKDSLGKTDFDIKFINEKNEVAHKKEHSVESFINNVSFKRVYREKWTKPRGQENEVLTTHETFYEHDGIAKTAVEFKKIVSELIDENMFKLLSSQTYFHSLKWEERRRILFSLIPEISNEELAGSNENFKKLISVFGDKSFEQYRSDIKARIKPLKKQLEDLTAEIEGTSKNIPSDIDLKPLIEEKDKLGNPNSENEKIALEIAEIEKEISLGRKSCADTYQKEVFIEQTKKRELANLQSDLDANNLSLPAFDVYRKTLIAKFQEVSDRTFSHTVCGTCGTDTVKILAAIQPFEQLSELYEELASKDVVSVEEFNKKKAAEILDINAKGKDNNIKKEQCIAKIKELEEKIANFGAIETPIFKDFDDTELRSKMPKFAVINEETVKRIAEINEQIGRQKATDEMNLKLSTAIEKQKSTASELAKLERTEFQCDKFAKHKSENFVQKINSLFKFCSFKFYESQMNGGELECCETLVNGIPYSSNVNTGAKINAGIEIINVLSKFHEISTVMFIDNMESCTDPIEPINQSVFLIADKNVKTLTIK